MEYCSRFQITEESQIDRKVTLRQQQLETSHLPYQLTNKLTKLLTKQMIERRMVLLADKWRDKMISGKERMKFAAVGIDKDLPISMQPMSKDNLLLVREGINIAYAMKYMGGLSSILLLTQARGFDWFYIFEIPNN